MPSSPEVELQPAGRFEWERIVRRCLIPLELKGVAALLASYGDLDGTRIRPGTPRFVAVCGKPERTLRRMVEQLLEFGLLQRVRNGGGPKGKAAEYRLTVPTDLLERVPMLEPDEVTPANNVREVAGDAWPVDDGSPANTVHGQAGDDSGVPVDNEVTPANACVTRPELPPVDNGTPANPEENSGQNRGGSEENSGQRDALTCGAAAPPNHLPPPNQNLTKVSTSPAQPLNSRARSMDAAEAAARPGTHQQLAVWPAAVPDPAPDADTRPGDLRARIKATRTTA